MLLRALKVLIPQPLSNLFNISFRKTKQAMMSLALVYTPKPQALVKAGRHSQAIYQLFHERFGVEGASQK